MIKRKFKFRNYKNFLEATQPDNKIKYLEISRRNNKSIFKTQQRFKSESKKIALSLNHDKGMQSSKDLVNKKEEI